jgi:phage terminase large subunit
MQVRFPNGSKIIFKGMDRPEKLKSINNVSLIWLEECSEIKYAGFKELLGRLRHPTLKLHMILSTNPVGEGNWTYKHFFRDKTNKRLILDDQILYKRRTVVVGDTYYHHSTAEDNLFLPQSYIEQLEEMKEYDPDLYRIARKGRFGVNGKRVLPQFKTVAHKEVMKAINKIKKPLFRVGMDFGFVESFNAVLRMAVDTEKHYLYIYWEYYKNGMTDDETAKDLKEFKESGEKIISDSAEPKTIMYYRKQGFNMYGAYKYQGSRLQNTKKMKRFKKIICSDACTNTINELEHLVYAKDKNGEIIEDDFEIDPHTFSAVWYGLDGYEVTDLKEESQGRAKTTRPKGRRR